MTHTDICNQVVIDFAKDKIQMHVVDNGFAFRKDGTPFHYGLENGFPDCFGNDENGKMYFVECKTKNDVLKPDQKHFLTRKALHGCVCYVAKETEEGTGYYLTRWTV